MEAISNSVFENSQKFDCTIGTGSDIKSESKSESVNSIPKLKVFGIVFNFWHDILFSLLLSPLPSAVDFESTLKFLVSFQSWFWNNFELKFRNGVRLYSLCGELLNRHYQDL